MPGPTARRLMRLAILALAPALALAGCADPASHPTDHFPSQSGDDADLTETDRSIRGLFPANVTREERLADGDAFALSAGYVTHDPGAGRPIRMMAYNGQLPGPTLRVSQHANVTIRFTNDLDVPTTVHWHGLRLDNAMDGVPHQTQEPVPPGGSFVYNLRFPDEGLFWYHPHLREDLQQELGLYGAILVDPPEGPAGGRELVLLLDDILLNGGDVATQYEEVANGVLMGRYGARLVANQDPDWATTLAPKERVRLHLANTANARPLNLTFNGADAVDLIALDAGRLGAPMRVDALILGPAERATIDLVAPTSGEFTLENDNGTGMTRLASFIVDPARNAIAWTPETAPHERAAKTMRGALSHAADPVKLRWELNVSISDNVTNPHGGHAGLAEEDGADNMSPIEWENADPFAGLRITAHQVEWTMGQASAKNSEAPTFLRGTYARIEIDNPGDNAHPMQHPIHLHGQRFLVQSVDSIPNERLAWKDTVLVPAGSSVVLLVEMSNPGTWMAHCHINEHLEAGMHTSFIVE